MEMRVYNCDELDQYIYCEILVDTPNGILSGILSGIYANNTFEVLVDDTNLPCVFDDTIKVFVVV